MGGIVFFRALKPCKVSLSMDVSHLSAVVRSSAHRCTLHVHVDTSRAIPLSLRVHWVYKKCLYVLGERGWIYVLKRVDNVLTNVRTIYWWRARSRPLSHEQTLTRESVTRIGRDAMVTTPCNTALLLAKSGTRGNPPWRSDVDETSTVDVSIIVTFVSLYQELFDLKILPHWSSFIRENSFSPRRRPWYYRVPRFQENRSWSLFNYVND